MSLRLPLSDVSVLDLTRARSGPTAVRQLADWGAEVIAIEAPAEATSGEDATGTRHGFDFQNLHRNKRSIVLDLRAEEGKAIFFKLAQRADVVVENYRPDVKHRLGIDYEAVRTMNPRIIYGSISGFGQSGPYRDRPGYDQIAQGMGGLMSVTGLPGQGPVRVGVPIADLTAGMYLAQGILVALYERERSGEGQWVHTSLLEAQIAMLDFQAARWLIAHQVPEQAGNDHPTGIPTGVFPTADGHINIAASGPVMFRRLCAALGAPELVEHPDYRDGASRSRNRVALNAALAAYTRQRTSAAWVQVLNEAGVASGPIYSVDQTLTDPQVLHLGIARPVDHPVLGALQVVGQPVHLERTPQPAQMRRPAPAPGEHTEEVLASLGYDAGAIAALRSRRII
ncbi:MAG: CoA transferase [Chloroflexi bacterium]|nr:CoA transferase [Chloroflexota bacterium]